MNNSRLVQAQLQQKAVGAIMGSLSQDALKSIQIPVPPREIQDKIAQKMEEAYRIKKEKEVEAERLLNSIDDYVLGELGITLPELKGERCFVVSFGQIKGKRLDPYYHQLKFKELERSFDNGSYKTDALGNHIVDIRYGASVKNIYVEKGIPLLRILNLKPNEFDLVDVVNLPSDKKKEIGRCFVEEGDFLISRSGSIGITAIVPREASGFAFGSFMIKFQIKEKEVVPFYLSLLINSRIVQEQIIRERIGATQGNITIPSIKNLNIPVPPLCIQQKIAKEVKSRREQAKRLKQEGKEAVERVKEEVERMILGESESGAHK